MSRSRVGPDAFRRIVPALCGLLAGVLIGWGLSTVVRSHNGNSTTAAFTNPGATATPTPTKKSPTPRPTPKKSVRPKPTKKPPKRTGPRLLSGPPKLIAVGIFDKPVYVTAPPGDSKRLFVVQKGGLVRIRTRNGIRTKPFLDIRKDTRTDGEAGLLSIAFAPDYAKSGKVYVDHVGANGYLYIDEYRVSKKDSNALDPRTRRTLLVIPKTSPNHNGGLMLFDKGARLLISTGDGGEPKDPAHRAQNLQSLLGKILRIDPRARKGHAYGIPPGNPFARGGGRAEILAYGLRNPWRFGLDPKTQALYVGDVGQYEMEEVSVVPAKALAGANFGWSLYEGTEPFNLAQPRGPTAVARPAVVYRHRNGRCAVTGGRVYRGRLARLRGSFVYGDFCTGEIFALRPTARRGEAPHRISVKVRNSLSSFGEDGIGELYAVTLEGTVYRFSG
jgi:glucose/arabinose dehydrogenase